MDVSKHPDAQEERNYLSKTQQVISQQIQNVRITEPHLAYPDATVEARWVGDQIEQLNTLKSMLESPYFGRLDFKRLTQTAHHSYYLGKLGISGLVYDWRAPIASLFYQHGFHALSYSAPGGAIAGDVLLRRRFTIQNRQLIDITDERPPSSTMPKDWVVPEDQAQSATAGSPGSFADEYLLSILSEQHGTGLQEIVATIQAEQDRIVRVSLDQPLIVQGAAGSGKTSIALHRVAYLLYTYNSEVGSPQIVDASRIIVFGPNDIFLKSIQNVLPQLGVKSIAQMTFEGWATRQLQFEGHLADAEEPIELFINPSTSRQASVALFRKSRLKGSLQMAKLLYAYTSVLRQTLMRTCQPLTIDYTFPRDRRDAPLLGYALPDRTVSLEVPVEAVRDVIRVTAPINTQRVPNLMAHRRASRKRLTAELWERLKRTPGYGSVVDARLEQRRQSKFREAIEEKVERQLRSWWPEYDSTSCYIDLFGSTERLAEANAQLGEMYGQALTSDQMQLLATDRTKHVWAVDDFPILCYLHILLNDPKNIRYDHIVIDEAQDFSPLQVLVLRHYVNNDSMTLLGDIAQSVYSYRGIRDWSEMQRAIGANVATVTISTSYRSTQEIVMLANDVLKNAHLLIPNVHPAISVARHGAAPGRHQCASWADLAQAAVTLARAGLNDGLGSVAIICKTAALCQRLGDALGTPPPDVAVVVERSGSVEVGQIAIIPAYLAKGLEFDLVVVAGADVETYRDTEYDAKLLYVAITRALHEVHVVWHGTLTSLL